MLMASNSCHRYTRPERCYLFKRGVFNTTVSIVCRSCRAKQSTEQSTYTESAYNKLPVKRKQVSFPNLYQGTSSLYVYRELRF